jgi:hypothetical protein
MPSETLARVIVIRVWPEAVGEGRVEWRGTLHIVGASDAQPVSFHGRAGLLDGVLALIPDVVSDTPAGIAPSDDD